MLDKTIAHFRILEKLGGGWNARVLLNDRMVAEYGGETASHPLHFLHVNVLNSDIETTDVGGTGHHAILFYPWGQVWSSYNNFSLDKAVVAACPIQIDYSRLPQGYRG